MKTHWRTILEWLVPSFNLKPELGARGKMPEKYLDVCPSFSIGTANHFLYPDDIEKGYTLDILILT